MTTETRLLVAMTAAEEYCKAKLAAEQCKDRDERERLQFLKRIAWKAWRKAQDEYENIPPGFN